MAEHFINSGHFDKAAQMLVFAKAFNEALQLCIDKNVKLTDEMAEAMTLPKSENEEDETYRISLLKKIAKVAKDQESWHLACKKYTQAGERVKAMKMLLRAGDTEKVIFFANHSRSNEIYVLAANYLQSQPWQQDANIYRNIVTFYTKAKAFDNLASFYDACSQLQIDEYRNYDNALVALREALKALDKADASLSKRQIFSQRIEIVETFVNARKMIQPGKPCVEMVKICTALIDRARPDHPDRDLVDSAIRIGDVFALLVEYYDKLNQADQAYAMMERMRAHQIQLSYFLEHALVERVCRSVGKDPRPLLAAQQNANAHPEDDFVEEEV
jgi:intraflagellar transport protein 140